MFRLSFLVLLVSVLCPSVYSLQWIFYEGENIIVRRNCSLHAENIGDLLSWYQMKGSKEVLLQRIQHTKSSSDEINLELVWTLEPTDQNTEIYCVKEGTAQDRKTDSTGRKNKFYVTSSKTIKPREKSHITVTPSSSPVYFDVNTTLTLICRGTKPIDGQELTWYIQEANSKLQLAETQTFNSTANVNTLTLDLDKTYNGRQLFCAQDFHLRRLPTADGTITIDKYRELARSNTIDLIFGKESVISEGETDNADREEGIGNSSDETDDNGKSLLIFALPVAVVVLVALVILGVVWYKRIRNVKSETGQDYSEYVNTTTDLTYAELESSAAKSGASGLETNQSCDYATVVKQSCDYATVANKSRDHATVANQSSDYATVANQSRGSATVVTSQPALADSSVSPEVTYAALSFAALAPGASKLKKDESCDYATVMTSQPMR